MRVASSTYVPHAALPNLHAECCAECCAEPLCSGYASLVINLSVFIRLTCGLQIARRFLCLYVPRAAPPHICTPSHCLPFLPC
jgi:hypothetical protein